MWDALAEIGQRENATLNQLCTQVATSRQTGGFTSNLRVFIVQYFLVKWHAGVGAAAQTTNASTSGSRAKDAKVESATPPATSSGAVLNFSANR